MAKRRPKTGEPRATRQPLHIDRLPLDVQDAILFLRNQLGKSWQYIEQLSGLPFDKKWAGNIGKHGFVDWDALPTDVLELFPKLRLPHTTLHRWYDLRIAQVKQATMERAAQAREIAEKFAALNVPGDKEAALNAARDLVFSLLQGEDVKARAVATKAMLALIEMQQEARLNDIKERKVAADERTLSMKEKEFELRRRRLEAETEKLSKKLRDGKPIEQKDLAALAERTFGFSPVPAAKGA